jgi:TFIIB-like protein
MQRCPLCRSALVTITFGLYPIAICTSCGARWIQDGHQQRAINQIQEPSLMAQEASLMAVAPLLAGSPASTLAGAHIASRPAASLEDSPW